MTIPPILMMLDTVPIETPEQVEQLRQIRNRAALLGTFSNDNDQISELRQRAWWVAMKGRVKAWLYYQSGMLVGYGAVIQDSGGNWWDSIAVLPQHQGLRFGCLITHDVAVCSGVTVHSKVRRDNLAAIAMHHAEDWEGYTILPRDLNYVGFVTRPQARA